MKKLIEGYRNRRRKLARDPDVVIQLPRTVQFTTHNETWSLMVKEIQARNVMIEKGF